MSKRHVILAALFAIAACGTDDPPDTKPGNVDPNNITGECTVGERTCQDTRTLATCARSSAGTPSLVTTTCLDSEECRDGDCVELPRDCSDLCTPPETRCTTTGEVETCADHNADGCTEFGGATACDAGEICDPADGLCKMTDCTDQCAEGETSCEDELITTCATAADGCLRFGQGKECGAGEACQAGVCMGGAMCTDECTEGELACSGDGKLRECRTDVDDDTCTEFTAGADCPSGETCRMGACVPVSMCQDQCIAGERVCLGNAIATCEVQADGCLAFPATPTDCPAGQTCQNMGGAMCAPVAVTGDVVINEIFYDPVGFDRRADGSSPSFIELYGPPGLSIANFTIVLVNGNGGADYATINLPSDAQLDGNGFAVVASVEADNFLGLALPFFTNVYFEIPAGSGNNDTLQNGPDNVRLLNAAGDEVDAVGYGTFGASDVFVGEGNPAPGVRAGHSLGRIRGADTNNNAADFISFIPTPGFENADLIINEIYFDQPGPDDGSETFVELVNPAILGWEDVPLDGYVLHAINGNDGLDYIFSGVLPGIEMSGFNLNDGDNPGYVVICNIDSVGPALLDVCTVPYEGVDFQNGPDNFVLRYNGRVIDAVGYGSFSASDTFVGEGSPAPFSSSSAGKSLARWKWSDFSRDLDTDDNSADFFRVDPTPGAENPLP